MKRARRHPPKPLTDRYLAAQQAVRGVLVASESLEEAMPSVLRAIGEAMGWDVGEFWRIDPHEQVLRYVTTWRAEGFQGRALSDAAERPSMAPGVGLPGRAWESGQALWVPDVRHDSSFVRRSGAARRGLRGACAFPLAVETRPGATCVGVVAFLTSAVVPPNPDMLAWLSALGGEIGQFAERRRAEREARATEAHFRGAFEHAAIGMAAADPDGRLRNVNDAFCTFLGRSRDALIGGAYQSLIHPDDVTAGEADMRRLQAGEDASYVLEKRYLHSSGRTVWGRVSMSVARGAAGTPQHFVVLVEDITVRRSGEAQRAGESRLLELTATGAPLPMILEQITLFIESQEPGLICSVLLLDEDGVHLRHGAAPSLPAAYLRAIDGVSIGPSVGSCGTAMYRRERVIVTDIKTDPLWTDYQNVGLPPELRACWSTPILARDGSVLGSFAMYYGEPRGPTPAELRLFDIATHLAGILIERARAQEALTLFRSLIDHTNDAIEVIDPETGRFLDVNAQACLAHGYTREEYLALTVSEIDPLVAARPWEETREEARRSGSRVDESQHRRKDGSVFPVEVNVSYIRLDRDYMLAVVRDITERKRVEAALRRSRDDYTALIHSIDGMVWEADAQTFVFSFVSQQAERLLGYPIERWLAEPTFWRDHVHPEDRELVLNSCRSATEEGRDHQLEYRMIAADGRTVWLRDIVSVVLRDGRPVTLRGLMVDITDAKRAQEALRTSEARFRTVVTTMAEGLVVTDLNEVIEFANDTYCSMLGRSRAEVEGHLTLEFAATPEDAALIGSKRALRAAGASDRYEMRLRTKEGAIRHAMASGGPFLNAAGQVVGSIGVIADITEQRELEARLRQAQKMEAVGRLAGGVAHDFNNVVTAIISYADLLLEAPDPVTNWRADVAEIRVAGRRAAELTKQLLGFSRQQIVQLRIVDVNRVILGVEGMLRRLIGEDVELVVAVDPTAGCVRADPGQIEQVLVNLAVNARDAMPQGGRLTLRTAAVAVDAALTAERSIVAPGPYVLVAVSDTGVGMDETTKAHIFEPFFTTKALGQGTGLGLATVYGIVKRAGGYVWVDSAPGRGTTFEVHLPRVEGETADEPAVVGATRPSGGGETILLVEDDASVRTVAQAILVRHGYVVIPADGPEAAIAEAARCEGRIDLIVMDLVLPEMSGRELAERLTSTWPGTKVLYVSGHAGETILRHGVLDSAAAFLPKPFAIDELLGKVREVLHAERPSQAAGHLRGRPEA